MRYSEVRCDIPGCSSAVLQKGNAGELRGWLRREVRDMISKEMAEGMRDFTARVVLHLCPEHLAEAHLLESPQTHPEVIEFSEQPDAGDGTGGVAASTLQSAALDAVMPAQTHCLDCGAEVGPDDFHECPAAFSEEEPTELSVGTSEGG